MVALAEDRTTLGGKRTPAEEAKQLVLYQGTRHENIELCVTTGLIPGGIGGGTKKRDMYFTSEDPWRKRGPVAGLCGRVSAVVVVDAAKRIDAGVQFWATSPGRSPRARQPRSNACSA